MINQMSLTGSPITDRLVHTASRLVFAVRNRDRNGIVAAIREARAETGGQCDPAASLAVVCAALVPDNIEPGYLLRWVPDEWKQEGENDGEEDF